MNSLEIETDADRGDGNYSAYHALWHLLDIGVVADLGSFAAEGWDAAAARIADGGRPATVALIDTSVAAHPNLADAIDRTRAIDFFSGRLGIPAEAAALSDWLGDTDTTRPGWLPAGAAALWTELVDHLTAPVAPPHASPVHPATRDSFSAHGTAMAGLIGARPVPPGEAEMARPGVLDLTTGKLIETGQGPGLGLAYAGVDPFCRVVPISTNFDPEPEQLVLSLLYAVLIRADVIVLARDFPAPASLAPDAPAADTAALSRALGVGLQDEEMALWSLLDRLVRAVSDRVPMICAAGNGAQEDLLYPASLAAPENGIVAVGARNAAGQPAGYTPVSGQVTLYAPSGDGERLDRGMQRVDTRAPGYDPADHSAAYRDTLHVHDADSGAPDARTFAPQDLVSTDVPGRAGYNSSPYAEVYGPNQAVLDYRSAFCRFSGTSGAVAVTAGLVALAVSAGRLTTGAAGDGPAAKARLTGGAASDHAAATPRLDWAAFSPSE